MNRHKERRYKRASFYIAPIFDVRMEWMFEKFKPTDVKWALTKPNPTPPPPQCTLAPPPLPFGKFTGFREIPQYDHRQRI